MLFKLASGEDAEEPEEEETGMYKVPRGLHILDLNKCQKNRRGNQEWTIQRNWKHWVHKTEDDGKQSKKTQHNMCWTTLYANKYI